MATPIIMPRQGQSVETCIITEWYKKKGDRVEVGDVLFSYETDKASFEEEAKEAGTLLEIFFGEDDEVPVLTTIAVLGEPGEDFSEFVPESQDLNETKTSESPSDLQSPDKPAAAAVLQSTPTPALQTEEIKISPRAKHLADKHHLDIRYAVPTGPEGRIIERDIRVLMETGPQFTAAAETDYLAQSEKIIGTGIGGRITTEDLKRPMISPDAALDIPAEVEYQDQPLTNIRKRIAQAMHESLLNTAQITINTSFDATAMLAYRKLLKAQQEKLGLENITINDLIVYGTARTLINYPALNAHLLDNTLRVFTHVHMGVAVDTERGLMVPTVFNADLKSLNQIAQNTKRIISQAQSGAINPDELQGGTFTITNLGTLGVESFTPILNPPQTGILGVGSIEYKVKVVNDKYVNYPAMTLSLTFDHRAVDGAPAARFLQELKRNLENFTLLLAK